MSSNRSNITSTRSSSDTLHSITGGMGCFHGEDILQPATSMALDSTYTLLPQENPAANPGNLSSYYTSEILFEETSTESVINVMDQPQSGLPSEALSVLAPPIQLRVATSNASKFVSTRNKTTSVSRSSSLPLLSTYPPLDRS